MGDDRPTCVSARVVRDHLDELNIPSRCALPLFGPAVVVSAGFGSSPHPLTCSVGCRPYPNCHFTGRRRPNLDTATHSLAVRVRVGRVHPARLLPPRHRAERARCAGGDGPRRSHPTPCPLPQTFPTPRNTPAVSPAGCPPWSADRQPWQGCALPLSYSRSRGGRSLADAPGIASLRGEKPSPSGDPGRHQLAGPLRRFLWALPQGQTAGQCRSEAAPGPP